MAVGDKQIRPTVVVVIKERGSPSDVRNTGLSRSRSKRDICKISVALESVKCVVFLAKVGNVQAELPVGRIVTDSDSHAALFCTVAIDCDACRKSHLLKFSIS